MATPIPLAYSYVRFSSKGQAGNDSERRQLELAESYAKKLGVALAPPMLDLGVSAFRGCNTSEKSALGRFLAAVTAGEIAPGSHLLIEAFDRFSRQTPLKSLKRIGELIDAGITIHVLSTKWVISQQTIDEQAHLLLVLTMYAQLANAESRQKSERISSSTADHRRRARLGEKFPGPKGPAWIDTVTLPDGKTDYVLNNSACAIQTIFELACTGMGAPNITKHLNNTKTPVVRAYASTQKNANRKLWYPAYVGRVITDRRAIGEYHPGKQALDGTYQPEGDPIPHYYPAVVTSEVWLKAQEMKSPNLGRKTGARKNQFSNLLTNGIAKCSCGASMTMRTDGGSSRRPVKSAQRVRRYLVCSNYLQRGGCENRRTVGYERFEQRLLDSLPAVPWSSLVQTQNSGSLNAQNDAEIADHVVNLQRLEASIARVLQAIEVDAQSSVTILTERLKTLVGQREATNAVLKRARDAHTLLKANEAADAKVRDELAILRAALAEANEDNLVRIRQGMHSLLLRVIDSATFDGEASHVHVTIRGGFCIKIPRGRTGEVSVGWIMYHPEARKRDAVMDPPPMKPENTAKPKVLVTPKCVRTPRRTTY